MNERATRGDRDKCGERCGQDAELARLRDRNVEVRGNITQNRRECQDARLAGEQGEESTTEEMQGPGRVTLRGAAVRPL